MLKTIVPNLDGIDAALHGFYKEAEAKDGTKQFVLQVTGIDDHPDVQSLKNAFEAQKTTNTDLRTKNSTLEAKAARLEGLPEDFDKKAYENLKALSEKEGKIDPAEIERLVNERVARVEANAAEKQAAIEADRDKFKSKLHSKELDSVLTNGLIAAGVKDDIYLKGAKAMLKDALEIVEDGDELSIIAKDKYGVPMPAEGFLKNWAETDEGKRFVGAPSSQGGGGGSGDPQKGGKTIVRSQFDKLDPAERSKKITEGFSVVDD